MQGLARVGRGRPLHQPTGGRAGPMRSRAVDVYRVLPSFANVIVVFSLTHLAKVRTAGFAVQEPQQKDGGSKDPRGEPGTGCYWIVTGFARVFTRFGRLEHQCKVPFVRVLRFSMQSYSGLT